MNLENLGKYLRVNLLGPDPSLKKKIIGPRSHNVITPSAKPPDAEATLPSSAPNPPTALLASAITQPAWYQQFRHSYYFDLRSRLSVLVQARRIWYLEENPVFNILSCLLYSFEFRAARQNCNNFCLKSVKHFKNSQQMDYYTDLGNSYADRERNSPSLFYMPQTLYRV
jgi:hypothetical protein